VSLLESRIESLERQLAQNVARIEETEEKNRKLQLAAAFKSGSTDAQEAKLKIGKIVREIDKCVALLNK
jgi:capsule polysaccharide export protein KpsE/RkpR